MVKVIIYNKLNSRAGINIITVSIALCGTYIRLDSFKRVRPFCVYYPKVLTEGTGPHSEALVKWGWRRWAFALTGDGLILDNPAKAPLFMGGTC
jgi:hypothetical protein